MKTLTDEEIKNLWRDPNFGGSFRGIRTFQAFLKTDLNIDVSEKRLFKVLKEDAVYLMHLQPKRTFERRHYDIRFYGELVQADIAYMFDYEGYKYFLLLIDCFSSKIFAEPLKAKDTTSTSAAFEKMFKGFKAPIQELQTDQGKEFVGKKTQELFKSNKIVFRQKFGKNKANFAENAIGRIKRKLYMLLRASLSHDWVTNLSKVVKAFNETPMKRLGFLKPNDIKSKIDSLKVQKAQEDHGYTKSKASEAKKVQNQFNINDYVYVDFKEKLFDKSYDVKVKANFKLTSRSEMRYNVLFFAQKITVFVDRSTFFSAAFCSFAFWQ